MVQQLKEDQKEGRPFPFGSRGGTDRLKRETRFMYKEDVIKQKRKKREVLKVLWNKQKKRVNRLNSRDKR